MLFYCPKRGVHKASLIIGISLIHTVTKIIVKVLLLQLAPHMDDIISNTQSAFIKRQSIHDNFMYVRNFSQRLHKCKTPALQFKLDIKFRAWIVMLLSSSSSQILLNRILVPPIKHGRRLWQGDPLSPYSLP